MVVTRKVVWAWAALMADKASKPAQAEDRILEKKAWVMVVFQKNKQLRLHTEILAPRQTEAKRSQSVAGSVT
jgi:hypothetical protein